MKNALFLAISLLVLAACTNPEAKEEKTRVKFLEEELLMPYMLSDSVSVYSVKVVLYSPEKVTISYIATLENEGITFKDSLIFDIEPNQRVNGQLIFSECAFKATNQPVLTSTVKILE